MTSHHITSHHMTSHHITSHHMTSHHITSYDITGEGSRSVCGAVSWVQVRGDARPRMVTRSPHTKPRAAPGGPKNQTCKYPVLSCPTLSSPGSLHQLCDTIIIAWYSTLSFPTKIFAPLVTRNYDTLITVLSSNKPSSSTSLLPHFY